MSIQNLILGSLVSRGADRLLNPNKFNKNQFNILTGGGYTGESEEKDKGPTTFGGVAKQGIMSLIAQAILGPVFGPLALTLGQNFAAKRQAQGLGLNPFGGDGPAGIVSNKAVTLDGNIVDVGSDDYYADLDARDKEFEETGDYDVYSNTAPTGPAYSGKATVGTRFDAEDDGGGSDDSSSGDTTGSGGPESMGSAQGGAGGRPYRYGGLASLHR